MASIQRVSVDEINSIIKADFPKPGKYLAHEVDPKGFGTWTAADVTGYATFIANVEKRVEAIRWLEDEAFDRKKRREWKRCPRIITSDSIPYAFAKTLLGSNLAFQWYDLQNEHMYDLTELSVRFSEIMGFKTCECCNDEDDLCRYFYQSGQELMYEAPHYVKLSKLITSFVVDVIGRPVPEKCQECKNGSMELPLPKMLRDKLILGATLSRELCGLERGIKFHTVSERNIDATPSSFLDWVIALNATIGDYGRERAKRLGKTFKYYFVLDDGCGNFSTPFQFRADSWSMLPNLPAGYAPYFYKITMLEDSSSEDFSGSIFSGVIFCVKEDVAK